MNAYQTLRETEERLEDFDERLKELDRHLQHAWQASEEVLHPHGGMIDLAAPKEEDAWTGRF